MRVIIDSEQREVIEEKGGQRRTLPLHSPEAFDLLSRYWLEVGWSQKYSYSFTWQGRPIVQLPEDLVRIQEVIHTLRPDLIIETGIAHGGGLLFYASLCKTMGKGRVVGVDIEIRPGNRAAIESHPLAELITLIEGSSVADEVVARVRQEIAPGSVVLILLDSCHSRDHVLAELRAYAPLVSPGSYIVATDGIMQDLSAAPGGRPDWSWNNPVQAVTEFLREAPAFALEEPAFLFNEGRLTRRVTYWPSAYLRRVA